MSNKLLLIGSNSVHTYNFCALVQDYFDEVVLITTTPPSSSNLANLKLSEVYVVETSLRHITNYFKAIKKLKGILRKERPDIIHIQQISTYSYLLFRALGNSQIPVVLTAWGSDVLITPQKGFLYKKMVQYCINRATALTADAKFIADRMQLLAKQNVSPVVANFGIELDMRPIHKENIIYSNRLHNPLYRIDAIIRAFHRFVIEGEGRSWKLLIAADGSETEKLKQLVIDLQLTDFVEFTGWLSKEENMANYAKSKIWISLPESDATAISLLEAMSMQCIPIVSDLPATKEWIQNTVNGLIISDVDNFDIGCALEINYDHLAQLNAESVLANATKQANRDKYISVYESIR